KRLCLSHLNRFHSERPYQYTVISPSSNMVLSYFLFLHFLLLSTSLAAPILQKRITFTFSWAKESIEDPDNSDLFLLYDRIAPVRHLAFLCCRGIQLMNLSRRVYVRRSTMRSR